MREAGADLWDWLQGGAHFYVCGDAKRMAKDVEATLVDSRGGARRAGRERREEIHRRAQEGGPLPGGCLLMNLAVAPPAVRTTCPYCGVGCGVLATPDGEGGAAIAGDPEHPANFGRLCSKGSALGETLGARKPPAASDDATRDGAMRARAGTMRSTLSRRVSRASPPSTGRTPWRSICPGQLLTEDYYVANKLMKGFLGTANVDTNSRLCMASSVAGHRRAFGADTVPGNYEDLDQADLIVLAGSNAAWCHPVLFQRMLQEPSERGAKIVVIDPRRTATAEERRSASCRSRPAWTA